MKEIFSLKFTTIKSRTMKLSIFISLLFLSSTLLESQTIGFFGGLNINQYLKRPNDGDNRTGADYSIGFGPHLGFSFTLPKKYRKHETFLLYFSYDLYRGTEHWRNGGGGAQTSGINKVERQIFSLTPYFLNLKRERFDLYCGPEISYSFKGESNKSGEFNNTLRIGVNLRVSYTIRINENLNIEPMYFTSFGITTEPGNFYFGTGNILHRIGVGISKKLNTQN